MPDRIFIVLLGLGLGAALLWRLTPPGAAPLDTAVDAAAGTMGVAPVAPTLEAKYVLGMSYAPGDGADTGGPTWYTTNYPGDRPGTPPMPPVARLP